MTHHILGDKDRDKFLPVMNGNGVTHKFWGDGTPAGPGLDNLLRLHLIQNFYFPQELEIDVRSFFNGTPHPVFLYFLLFTIYASDFFLSDRVLYPFVGFPQGVVGCLPPDDFPSPPPIG